MACGKFSDEEVANLAKFLDELNSTSNRQSMEVNVRFLGDDRFMLYAWNSGSSGPNAVIFNETMSTPTCDQQAIIDQLRQLPFWPEWLYPAVDYR